MSDVSWLANFGYISPGEVLNYWEVAEWVGNRVGQSSSYWLTHNLERLAKA